MSLKLIIVLVVLMVANQLLGTSYGCWKNGFKKDLFLSGLWKIASLAICYAALAFAAQFASQYVPEAEYLSALLVEPIAKYFSKICETLRRLLSDSVSETVETKRHLHLPSKTPTSETGTNQQTPL